ncbi:MAG: phosphoribosyltransferase [Parcubacteria group bacterium Gr01-1014_17]|nr:MAG: phosphoribosyltransferase [Parcubacteria group bacterium Gr01-1014_17]
MLRFLLNLLFPPSARVAEVEQMSAAAFRDAVPPLSFQPREWALPLFPYENPLVKTAVWEVKYRGNTYIARLMGELLANELAEWLIELSETENFRAPLIVPIPLAPKRRAERGLNQCELLAREMMRELQGLAELNALALIKVKETESQTKSKNRDARIKNLEDCFVVKNPAEIKGRNIVLLDDVTTTGATLAEARRTLLARGARKVIAITFAH